MHMLFGKPAVGYLYLLLYVGPSLFQHLSLAPHKGNLMGFVLGIVVAKREAAGLGDIGCLGRSR